MKMWGTAPSGLRWQKRSRNASVVGPSERSLEEYLARQRSGGREERYETMWCSVLRGFVENLVELGVGVHRVAGVAQAEFGGEASDGGHEAGDGGPVIRVGAAGAARVSVRCRAVCLSLV